LGAVGALVWLEEAPRCRRSPAHGRAPALAWAEGRGPSGASIAEPPACVGEAAVSDVNLAVLRAARLPEPGAACPEFATHKAQVLDRTLRRDKSPKGSVDPRVVDILAEINRRNEYVTTSSCSGRVFFMAHGSSCEEPELPDFRAKVGRWRHVSHDGIEDAEAYFNLDSEPVEAREHLWLKVQPFSLDVACASAAAAHRLVAVAREVFQRGASTISPGCEWKTVVSIEGHERLEMPFTMNGQRAYNGSLQALAGVINGKLSRNWERMDSLLAALRRDL